MLCPLPVLLVLRMPFPWRYVELQEGFGGVQSQIEQDTEEQRMVTEAEKYRG